MCVLREENEVEYPTTDGSVTEITVWNAIFFLMKRNFLIFIIF